MLKKLIFPESIFVNNNTPAIWAYSIGGFALAMFCIDRYNKRVEQHFEKSFAETEARIAETEQMITDSVENLHKLDQFPYQQ